MEGASTTGKTSATPGGTGCGGLRLPNGIPSHDTFNRLFQALAPAVFAEAFAQWTQGLRQRLEREVVAPDGKAARRAAVAGQGPRHLVSGWATGNGLTLGQLQVTEQSNEITVVPALLRQLALAGCLVTAAAPHCQKSIAREITETDADYVLALKGNQGTVHEEVRAALDDVLARQDPALATLAQVDKGHGQLEPRRYWQSDRLEWFADRVERAGLRSVGVVEAAKRAELRRLHGSLHLFQLSEKVERPKQEIEAWRLQRA